MKFQGFSFLHGKAVLTKLEKHINCGSLVLIAVKPFGCTVYFPLRIVEISDSLKDTTVRGTPGKGHPTVIAGYAPALALAMGVNRSDLVQALCK